MMTSSNGNIFRVTGPLCGEFTGPDEFPTQRPVTRSFDIFFDLRLNKRLSKQSWGWWFETPSWSLWRQCNGDNHCSVAVTQACQGPGFLRIFRVNIHVSWNKTIETWYLTGLQHSSKAIRSQVRTSLLSDIDFNMGLRCYPGPRQIWVNGSHWIPQPILMMTSSNANIFCVTGPLCGEFTGHRWIPLTKASDAELWYFL